jgi:Taurine catabolism dioxygenase TauD, TfdA family
MLTVLLLMRKQHLKQIFNCVAAASGGGGASTYVDGFAVGQQLKEQNPPAFEFFCSTPLRYFCYDTGYHLEAAGPVFRLGAGGQIVQV